MSELMEKIKTTTEMCYKIATERIRAGLMSFVVLTSIYLLGIVSIIRANFKYIDDLGRVFSGYKGWDDFSRFTSYGLSAFIHADNYLTDISPIPQILACILLGIAGTIAIAVLKRKDSKITVWHIVAMIPLGLSPYFLECLSYKYDSVYMALSVLAAVLPMAFIESGYIVFGIASILGTLLMLTTYQASSGIFPMIIILWTAKQLCEKSENKPIFLKTGVAAGGYLLAMIVDKLFIIREVDEYVSSSIAPFGDIIRQFKDYYIQVYADFKKWWLALIAVIVILYIVMYVYASKRRKVVACVIGALTVALCIIFAFGMYPVLKSASYYPRAMYGFGVMIALISVSAVDFDKSYPSRICAVMLGWTFLVFAVSYGNALSEQQIYTQMRVEAVVNDLIEIDAIKDEEPVVLQLDGTIGKAPSIRNTPQEAYGILDRLVPETFAGDWKWSKFYFYNYFGLGITEDRQINLSEMNLPVIKDTLFHTIRGKDHEILIELKGSEGENN